jgi:5-oxoprolinase (ATP-hydrolysing)
LGQLDTRQFSIPIVKEHAQARLDELVLQVTSTNPCEGFEGLEPSQGLKNTILHEGLEPSQGLKNNILQGFIKIANEKMAEAVRKISVAKGYDPAQYALVAFGGAGGLHACGIANLLNIKTILLPKDAGLLSAFGIAHASIERFAEASILKEIDNATALKKWFTPLIKQLDNQAIQQVKNELSNGDIVIRKRLLFMRLKGQDTSIEVSFTTPLKWKEVANAFKEKYLRIYGYWNNSRAIEIETVRVIATSENKPVVCEDTGNSNRHSSFIIRHTNDSPEPLQTGNTVDGFALLLDPFSTTVIEKGWALSVQANGTVIIQKQEVQTTDSQEDLGDATELELFMNRFTAIAENMGVMLQRTSLSVNVKERLDFSCALLDPQGELIANAPHIPVHLGSLGVCVRKVMKAIDMQDGDVVITNHPAYGGSHLPDVTLISPVFEQHTLIGYVVNRCHHAEIGGIRPASMPPDAQNLAEEGVVIPPMYLVKNGKPRWDEIRTILTTAPYPTRSVEENLADLNAAVAANRNGEQALQTLVRQHGTERVLYFMEKLKAYTAHKMTARLRLFPTGERRAEELLDDGTKLCVSLCNNLPTNGTFDISFEGSASVHKGNLNGNDAIVQSVVVYVLRTLLQEKIPLNDGILRSVNLTIPANSILNPDFPANPAHCPAVVGGNVELSQRLTDTLLKAFGVVACSQGTMNNTLFGNESFGYYETLCGGCGASEGRNGASAVHHHMTNTRITDPEIMELRYPVRLHRFEIRKDSGGKGTWYGGDGIEREIEFLAPVKLSILSQHRQQAPYGMKGGDTGKTGEQYLVRQSGEIEPLEGIAGANLYPHDRLVIKTPGGGGWGKTE